MTKPLTFLVVDDHPVFRQGLVALIRSDDRYEVCAEAGTAAETLAALERAVPDIALIDISLVGQNGLDLVKTLKAAHPEILVLIISMHDEVIYAERALKAGARGYVMKQEAASVMLDAIKTVLSGKIYVSATMRDRLLETMFSARDEAESPSVERLSDRELEVLDLMGCVESGPDSNALQSHIEDLVDLALPHPVSSLQMINPPRHVPLRAGVPLQVYRLVAVDPTGIDVRPLLDVPELVLVHRMSLAEDQDVLQKPDLPESARPDFTHA